VDQSNKSKGAERREFWREAVRLWAESGLSVREFCSREGLAEHALYSWRRKLPPESAVPEIDQESSAMGSCEASTGGRRRRRRNAVAAANTTETAVSVPFIELLAPTSAGLCHCMLELENTGGAKMQIQLRSVAMPDLAAISQSFWNHSS
jgi:transposase-like protein